MGKKAKQAPQQEICWSCQQTLPFGSGTDGGRVRLSETLYLPVCRDCWERIPETERLRLAILFRDRGHRQDGVASALEWVSTALAMTNLSPTIPQWMRGGEDVQN